MRTLVLTVVLASLWLTCPRAVDAQQRSEPPAFLAAVSDYRGGQFDAVVDSVIVRPPSSLELEAAERFVSDGDDEGLERALGALAVEVLLVTTFEGAEDPAAHEVFKAFVDRRLKANRPGKIQDRARRQFWVTWHQLAASTLLASGRAVTADQAGGGVDDEPVLQLLAASVEEERVIGSAGGLASARERSRLSAEGWSDRTFFGQYNLSGLRRVAQLYRTLAEGHPNLVEARLRLGRVLAYLDEPDAARTQLKQVIDANAAPSLTYLALLFLGTLELREGAPDAAYARLEAAVALFPGAPSSRLALGHALVVSGPASDGWTVIRNLFSSPDHPGTTGPDPWATYRHGQIWNVQSLVADMRRGVMP